ncbi:hypothetical protein AUI06_00930 [archaeon 13_2_20CM_2_52_21]|nr:MAG: hypothetical protein AUI06_00930 [archaeon 13_2_20CM_2_52_21]OLD08031.1 MAG: hypothetical protein AUI95_04180 [Crenarchaeota archaeon 13_1_40CM_3_52_4]
MEEKRPRARHRFDFSGRSKTKEAPTTTDQILNSLNRQTQPSANIGEDQGNLIEESVEIPESEQLDEYAGGRSIGRWLFLGTLASLVVALWALDLFPRILYADTIGSIDNLLPMIPRIDIMIIVIIWMAALFFGLVGRGLRHASRTRRH